MAENNTATTDTFGEEFGKSAAAKAGEHFASRALNGILDFVGKEFGQAKVRLGQGFTRYLNNAATRYNSVKTIATGNDPRSIIGPDNIYVSIGVEYKNKEISTDTVEPLLSVGSNVLILGTGGIGKSMLMRYLFLNSIHRGECVPVLLELRKINEQKSGKLSITELIYSCMKSFDVELPKPMFMYSLRLGKYLFLFDGLDEIKDTLLPEAEEKIQAFASEFPKNPCIITSRPQQEPAHLETFIPVKAKTLSKAQAVCLAKKIWREDEKTIEFCRQLEEALYDKHKSFAEIPLLLSMMGLTFMRNSSIPDHLADFYQKAYDALYSIHDSHDKGFFHREFKCKNLDERRFTLLWSRFCFITYFDEKYEFLKSDIIEYLQNSIRKLGLSSVSADDFLLDLRNVVCMIIEDGTTLRFSHRTFQSYFAAVYTVRLTDAQQKRLFQKMLEDPFFVVQHDDYFKMLSQIEFDRFMENAFEDNVKELLDLVNREDFPEIALLKAEVSAVKLEYSDKLKRDKYIRFVVGTTPHLPKVINTMYFFGQFSKDKPPVVDFPKSQRYLNDAAHFISKYYRDLNHGGEEKCVYFDALDSCSYISREESINFYNAICTIKGTFILYKSMMSFCNNLKKAQESLEFAGFIDDL